MCDLWTFFFFASKQIRYLKKKKKKNKRKKVAFKTVFILVFMVSFLSLFFAIFLVAYFWDVILLRIHMEKFGLLFYTCWGGVMKASFRGGFSAGFVIRWILLFCSTHWNGDSITLMSHPLMYSLLLYLCMQLICCFFIFLFILVFPTK